MKSLLLAFCLTGLLLTAARAEEKVTTIELKQKSAFDSAPNDRDPFWPIGWKKPGPKIATTGVGPDLTASSFSLTSVTMGLGQRFAILNGKVMQEGQKFGLQFGSQVYQVTLQSIEDGQVTLDYQGAEIVVPLRRK
ncbi:MAG: hypothetical protein ABI217_08150 [Chthoniobacterales bacterium]